MRSTFRLSLFLLVVLLSLRTARADDSTRAARLTYLQGNVTVLQPGGSSIPAQLNMPLLAGVQISTSGDGQGEVEFEDGSVIRLTPNSALSLVNLTAGSDGVFTTSVSLLHGLAYAELRATPQYRYAVGAGGDVLSPVENTTVRIDYDQPPAIFAVLDGSAHIERQNSPGFEADVRAGESLSSDSGQTSYSLNEGIAINSWDQWNQDLDQSAAAQAASSTSVRNDYAGSQGYGWSDLDANGTWYDVPGQGQLWQPQQAADDSSFDPYGDGAWVSYAGAGYLWASAYSWGWTPYRCGNWSFFGGFGWGWSPGAGCGTIGWGFAPGGRPVNIASAPNGYRPIRVPVPGHGPERPWLPVHEVHHEPVPTTVEHGPRQIAGETAVPIRPVSNGFRAGNPASGSSLDRDYPVDSLTRTPIMGMVSSSPAIIHINGAGLQVTADRPARAMAPAATVWPSNTSAYRGRSNPPTALGAAPASPQYARPNQVTPQYHPNYSSPPQRPMYSPPHPSYSPPPARPSAPAGAPARGPR